MTNVVVTIGTTLESVPPQGVGAIRVALCDSNNVPVNQQDVIGTTATFSEVPTGNYYVVTQQLDASGLALGAAVVSGTVTVPSSGATQYNAPSSVSVSLV